jgi:hypothetical protein
MKNKCDEAIVYSINVDDLQEVADQVLERPLTKKELTLVQKSVGDYIDWFQAIEFAIQEHIKK